LFYWRKRKVITSEHFRISELAEEVLNDDFARYPQNETYTKITFVSYSLCWFTTTFADNDKAPLISFTFMILISVF